MTRNLVRGTAEERSVAPDLFVLLAVSLLLGSCSGDAACLTVLGQPLPAPRPGCEGIVELSIANTCSRRVSVLEMEFDSFASVQRRGAISLDAQSTGTVGLAVAGSDGGLFDVSFDARLSDGSNLRSSVQFASPPREAEEFRFPIEPIVDVVMVLGTPSQSVDIRSKLALLLTEAKQWSFYRFHVVGEIAGQPGLVRSPDGRVFVDSSNPEFIAVVDDMLARASPVPNHLTALEAVLPALQLSVGSDIELISIGSGSEVWEPPVTARLAPLLEGGRRITGVWLFVAGAACPAVLSPSYQELLALPSSRLLDLCSGEHQYTVAQLVRTDVNPLRRFFLGPDVFLPSLSLSFDAEVSNGWRIEDTSNGRSLVVDLDSYWGHQFMYVRYDKLTECEAR